MLSSTRRIRKVSTVRLFKKKRRFIFKELFLSDMPYLTLLVSTIIEAFIVTGYQFLYYLVVERSRL
jgi:hypothetical protein